MCLTGARASRLNHVRINRTLREEVDACQLVSLFIEHFDEGAANDLSFLLGIGHTGKARQESLLRIYPDDVDTQVLGERGHDLIAFTETQKASVDKHADELVADRAMQERSNDRGVNTTGKSQQHLSLSNLRTNTVDCVFDDVADAPESVTAADLANESFQDPRSLFGMGDLGMELNTVETALFISHCRVGNGLRRGRRLKTGRKSRDPIAMTHPDIQYSTTARVTTVLDVVEQLRIALDRDFRVAEFAFARCGHLAAQLLRHGLHAVADTQDGYAQRKYRLGRFRRLRVGD